VTDGLICPRNKKLKRETQGFLSEEPTALGRFRCRRKGRETWAAHGGWRGIFAPGDRVAEAQGTRGKPGHR